MKLFYFRLRLIILQRKFKKISFFARRKYAICAFSGKKSLANLSDTFSLGMVLMGGNARLLFLDTFSSISLSSFSLVVSPGGESRKACDFERHRRAQRYLKVPKTFGEEVSLEVTRIVVLSASTLFTPFSFTLS